MIRVDRSLGQAPATLLADGPVELSQVVQPAVSAGTLSSKDFKTSVYGTKAVKQALWDMQHGKCCFCEKECEVAFATVEHFRPKTSARDDANATRPGYWWLAYEFENLYLCCSNCNTPKGNYFPLAPGATSLAPPQLPWQQTVAEACLLIDDDPEAHVRWVFIAGRGPVPVGLDARGDATIRAVNLDGRDELTKLRARFYKKYIEPLIARFRAAQQANDAAAQASATAAAKLVSTSDSTYAGMARAMLRQAGIL